METDLPNQVARLNRMHQQICGMNDLIHVADGINLLFKYRGFWTAAKMRRSAPSAISIPGLFRTSRRFAKRMTGYSKTEHPFSRIRLTCFFDNTHFKAFDVPLHSGTRGTSVPQLEPTTS